MVVGRRNVSLRKHYAKAIGRSPTADRGRHRRPRDDSSAQNADRNGPGAVRPRWYPGRPPHYRPDTLEPGLLYAQRIPLPSPLRQTPIHAAWRTAGCLLLHDDRSQAQSGMCLSTGRGGGRLVCRYGRVFLVCSWRRPLADRHSLPFPWTLCLHRRWCPSASPHPVSFLFPLALSFPLYFRGAGGRSGGPCPPPPPAKPPTHPNPKKNFLWGEMKF